MAELCFLGNVCSAQSSEPHARDRMGSPGQRRGRGGAAGPPLAAWNQGLESRLGTMAARTRESGGRQGGRFAYLAADDEAMRRWVTIHPDMKTQGKKLWKAAERAAITRHSWASMQNRWRRSGRRSERRESGRGARRRPASPQEEPDRPPARRLSGRGHRVEELFVQTRDASGRWHENGRKKPLMFFLPLSRDRQRLKDLVEAKNAEVSGSDSDWVGSEPSESRKRPRYPRRAHYDGKPVLPRRATQRANCLFAGFPEEICANILQHLEQSEVFRAATACRPLREAADLPQLYGCVDVRCVGRTISQRGRARQMGPLLYPIVAFLSQPRFAEATELDLRDLYLGRVLGQVSPEASKVLRQAAAHCRMVKRLRLGAAPPDVCWCDVGRRLPVDFEGSLRTWWQHRPFVVEAYGKSYVLN